MEKQTTNEATELQSTAQETANGVAETELADSELEGIAGGRATVPTTLSFLFGIPGRKGELHF
jgi:hypothetical protein